MTSPVDPFNQFQNGHRKGVMITREKVSENKTIAEENPDMEFIPQPNYTCEEALLKPYSIRWIRLQSAKVDSLSMASNLSLQCTHVAILFISPQIYK